MSIQCDEQFLLLKVKDEEMEKLQARLSLVEAEAVEVIHLRVRVSVLESFENSLKEQNSAF